MTMGGGRLNGRAPGCNPGVATPQAGSIPAHHTNLIVWCHQCGEIGRGHYGLAITALTVHRSATWPDTHGIVLRGEKR